MSTVSHRSPYLVEIHSENKAGTAATYKSGFGFHPLLCFADATGETLATLLRPGNAGGNTSADHLCCWARFFVELVAALPRPAPTRPPSARSSSRCARSSATAAPGLTAPNAGPGRPTRQTRRVETSLRTGKLGDTPAEHRRFTVVFEIGAKVISVSHGVAEIVGRESQAINGATETYLVLSVLQPGWGTRGWMQGSLPEDRAEALGVRAAISREDAADVIELLGMSDVHVPGNWARRFKNHQEKLKSVTSMTVPRWSGTSPSTSASPRWPLRDGDVCRARHSLISELAVSWGIGDDEAETRVDGGAGAARRGLTGPAVASATEPPRLGRPGRRESREPLD